MLTTDDIFLLFLAFEQVAKPLARGIPAHKVFLHHIIASVMHLIHRVANYNYPTRAKPNYIP